MREYEVALVLHPDLEIDPEAPMERLQELFDQAGANVTKRDEWGKRKLAYPINNQTFGIYVFYRIECQPDQTQELERQLRLMNEVMRHLIVTYEMPPRDERSSGEGNESEAGSAEAAESGSKTASAGASEAKEV